MVYLVEKKPNLGGFLPLLDRQFPTNDCNICYLVPETDHAGRTVSVEALAAYHHGGGLRDRRETSPPGFRPAPVIIDLSRMQRLRRLPEGLPRRGHRLYARSGHKIALLPALSPSHSRGLFH